METKVMLVGGDGFCGWPLALYLSEKGFEVTLVDNLSRRKIDDELNVSSLVPIYHPEERIRKWWELTEKRLSFHIVNVATEYEQFVKLLEVKRPEVIVHLGEQRAAPYSMKSISHMRYTVDNNLRGTHNILCAILEQDPSIHLVHLGTMGVYGYGALKDMLIPEGYLDVECNGQKINILCPSDPGSIYHMTKTQDALFFQFFAKNYGLKITDLHQGIIWGGATQQTSMHPVLANRFDYDGDYGTVFNRFIIQSVANHPMTVYGSGEQTRAFIHIQDSMRCIQLAIENPPEQGERVKIFNQMTEARSLIELANLIQAVNPSSSITHLENPRNELSKNSLKVKNQQFLDLGLRPKYINAQEIGAIMNLVAENIDRVDSTKIMPLSFWQRNNMLKKA